MFLRFDEFLMQNVFLFGKSESQPWLRSYEHMIVSDCITIPRMIKICYNMIRHTVYDINDLYEKNFCVKNSKFNRLSAAEVWIFAYKMKNLNHGWFSVIIFLKKFGG